MTLDAMIAVTVMVLLCGAMLVIPIVLSIRSAKRVAHAWSAFATERGFRFSGKGLFLLKTRVRIEGEVEGASFVVTVAKLNTGAEYRDGVTTVRTTRASTPSDFYLKVRSYWGYGEPNVRSGDPRFDVRLGAACFPPGEVGRQLGPRFRAAMLQLNDHRTSLTLTCTRGRYNLPHYLGKVTDDAPADVELMWPGSEIEAAVLDLAILTATSFSRGQ